ncbi:MAG TPA: nitroreductase [Pseudomonadales bacterium]|nr:nitroreductase [Pseudomonadales bacterium]
MSEKVKKAKKAKKLKKAKQVKQLNKETKVQAPTHDEGTANETLELLLTRRSVKALELCEPGPDATQLDAIVRAGIRVPDHGKLGPWRFIRFLGEARSAFGDVLVEAFRAAHPGESIERAQLEHSRFTRAPVVIGVVSSVTPEHKIPEWEQVLSAGAVCQNMLLAAHAQGYAAQWLTEWYAYDAGVARALQLGDHERIAGWIYIGTARRQPEERVRPEPAQRVSDWGR